MSMKKQYIFSVKKRSGYLDKTAIIYEVYVKQPDYKDYSISVGGLKPYTFDNQEDAIADCDRRIAEKIAQGHDASFSDSVIRHMGKG